jgi:hypothetical protein
MTYNLFKKYFIEHKWMTITIFQSTNELKKNICPLFEYSIILDLNSGYKESKRLVNQSSEFIIYFN